MKKLIMVVMLLSQMVFAEDVVNKNAKDVQIYVKCIEGHKVIIVVGPTGVAMMQPTYMLTANIIEPIRLPIPCGHRGEDLVNKKMYGKR